MVEDQGNRSSQLSAMTSFCAFFRVRWNKYSVIVTFIFSRNEISAYCHFLTVLSLSFRQLVEKRETPRLMKL